MVEERIEFDGYIPEGFGTSDFNIAAGKILTVIDFKFGQGVPVSAAMNPQAMIYALGVYEQVKYLHPVESIEIVIFQPRIDNTDTWKITVDFLLDWAEKVLKPRAKLAFEGKGKYEAGHHCKFCAAKGSCRTLADYNRQLIRHDFQLPELLSAEEIAEIINRADVYINWINAVKDYAIDQAKRGEQWPGLKLVEGRSNRIITNERKAMTWLKLQGYATNEVMENRLLPLTKLETILAKGELHAFLQRFVIKPKGAPTLVPVTDKRPALNSYDKAREDFKDLLT